MVEPIDLLKRTAAETINTLGVIAGAAKELGAEQDAEMLSSIVKQLQDWQNS